MVDPKIEEDFEDGGEPMPTAEWDSLESVHNDHGSSSNFTTTTVISSSRLTPAVNRARSS
jgi:hypothetical protein